MDRSRLIRVLNDLVYNEEIGTNLIFDFVLFTFKTISKSNFYAVKNKNIKSVKLPLLPIKVQK